MLAVETRSSIVLVAVLVLIVSRQSLVSSTWDSFDNFDLVLN